MENFENKGPASNEDTDEETFQRYVEDLKLEPGDFNKKILDVGAGSTQFAKWAREHGVSNDIYSIELVKERIMKEGKSMAAKAEEIPFANESFGLVLSDCAIPNIFINEKDAEEKTNNSLREMVRVLKPGGEIRLARVLIGEEYEPQRILAKAVEKILKNLEKESNIEIRMIRTPADDTYENDENNNPIKLLAKAHRVLIKKIERKKI